MTTSSHSEYSVPPVQRAFKLLRYIADGNRCQKSSRAAKEIGINRTTLIRLLATLEAEGMIEQLPDDGGYQLGTGIISLASSALGDRAVVSIAQPVLQELVRKLGLSAHLGIREGHEIVYLARETPVSHLASTVRVGTRLQAHATTIGRILLAHMDKTEFEELYQNQQMEAFTEKTRTNLQDLTQQLEQDRRCGIAWSMANFEPDIGSAAVAVFDYTGRAIAAINVTGHASVFAPDGTLVASIEDALVPAASDISKALGFTGNRPAA